MTTRVIHILFVLFVFLFSACAPAATAASPSPTQTAVPVPTLEADITCPQGFVAYDSTAISQFVVGSSSTAVEYGEKYRVFRDDGMRGVFARLSGEEMDNYAISFTYCGELYMMQIVNMQGTQQSTPETLLPMPVEVPTEITPPGPENIGPQNIGGNCSAGFPVGWQISILGGTEQGIPFYSADGTTINGFIVPGGPYFVKTGGEYPVVCSTSECNTEYIIHPVQDSLVGCSYE